jgi:hypothetical protein
VVRAAALLGVLTLLAVYYGISESLPDLGLWGDVAFVGLVLIPAFFSLTWLALPLWQAASTVALGGAVVALVVLALLFSLAGLDVAANFVKFAAVTAAGWWFLAFFESVTWVLLRSNHWSCVSPRRCSSPASVTCVLLRFSQLSCLERN